MKRLRARSQKRDEYRHDMIASDHQRCADDQLSLRRAVCTGSRALDLLDVVDDLPA